MIDGGTNGSHPATGNRVTCIHLRGNHVSGTVPAILVEDNWPGARGNKASLAGC